MGRTVIKWLAATILLSAVDVHAEGGAEDEICPAVVKVQAVQQLPDFLKPWTKTAPRSVSGSRQKENHMAVYATTAAGLAWALVAGSTIGAEKAPIHPVVHFSDEYSEAREKFLRAAGEADAVLECHENGEEGPGGEPLFTDVAILGPSDASNVLVVVSGTHGVEGFCGSGLQTALLRNGLAARLPNGVKVVLVHALNPYGMAWLRRVNEDNVDVNRNFIDDYRNPPQNADYVRLADIVCPKEYSERTPDETHERLLAFAEEAAQGELRKLGVEEPHEALQAYVAKLGELRLRAAIHRGQYTHPKGLFFGGTQETWSNGILRKIVTKHVLGARRVVLIDLHTGLGPYGHGECLLDEPVDSEAYKRARAWWGNTVKSPKADGAVHTGITGSLPDAFVRMFPGDTEVTAITLEFGTYDSPELFFAMQAENWLHHHATPDDPQWQRIKQEMLRVYYPSSDGHWKKMVWARAEYVLDQALAHIDTGPRNASTH